MVIGDAPSSRMVTEGRASIQRCDAYCLPNAPAHQRATCERKDASRSTPSIGDSGMPVRCSAMMFPERHGRASVRHPFTGACLMLHSGIDVHKRTAVIATVDADCRRVREAQLPTTRAALATYFASLPGGAAAQRAVVDSTSTRYWLRDLRVTQGIDLRLRRWPWSQAARDTRGRRRRARHASPSTALLLAPEPSNGVRRRPELSGYSARNAHPCSASAAASRRTALGPTPWSARSSRTVARRQSASAR